MRQKESFLYLDHQAVEKRHC